MRRSNSGYTTIEVAMALALLAVGAAGAIALQRIALVGNLEARAQDGARQVGSTWVSRLETDSLRWTDKPNDSNIATTHWLNASIEKDAFAPPSASEWLLAPEAIGFGSPTAAITGDDVYSFEAQERGFFCTHLRLYRVIDENTVGVGAPRKSAVLAGIRVVWRRDLGPMMECRTKPPPSVELEDERYAFYYLPPTVILRREAFE